MAIMVGGGLTFAIPGMEPAYAAQISSNPNLKVSAEGQNADNEITHINIIEVIVRDSDIGDLGDSEPIIVVDDNTVLDMRFFSGAWYGYFASDKIDESGLVATTNADGDDLDADGYTKSNIDDLVRGEPTFDPLPLGAPTPAPGDDDARVETGDPLVTLYTLDGEFDVVYEKPANEQSVTLELDDPDVSVSLDRTNYPRNTDVAVTIDDMAMNVDPTSEDTWFLVVGNASDSRYATADDNTDNVADVADEAAKRDAKIAKALADRNRLQASAESDRDDLIKRADAARQVFVNDARDVRDALLVAAQVVIDNPLLE